MSEWFEMIYNHADATWDIVKRPGNICVFSSENESEASDQFEELDAATSA